MTGVIGHVSLGVDDLDAAGRFYDGLLGAIGAPRRVTLDAALAWGRDHAEFWVGTPIDGRPASVGNGTHVALLCERPEQVRAAYAAALAAGGTGDGDPGPRPEYTPDYYAAFLRDPAGNKVEVYSL